MPFSRLLNVRQHFPDRGISDIPGAVQRELSSSGFSQALKPGARIAIGVGSRGIANIATIVHSAVDFWKSRGFQPFLFPAMGSHGAATAAGQAEVLAHYGIDEASMGCPILSALEVVSLGKTADGIEAFIDRNAYLADGVFLIGRVKWHTDFAGKIESGLFKMMAIGLGKFAGAQRYHTYAYRLGLEHVIRTVGRQVLGCGKILGGLAILEDANHQTAQLTAVPVGEMETKEEELLALAKSWMGRIPFPLNILILDEIGKNFSGAGMDTKVVNRGVMGEYNPWDTAPNIDRIFLRGLSPHSYGNAARSGHGRHHSQPAARRRRLDAYADQFAHRVDALRHTHADSFFERSRMPGQNLAHHRPSGAARRHHRMDRQLARARDHASHRKSARGDRGQSRSRNRRRP